MNILEMMKDLQRDIEILRYEPAKFIKGQKVGKTYEMKFKVKGFCAPTKNNSLYQSQGSYSFTSIDIYTIEKLNTDNSENKFADRVIVNNKTYKILGCNNCYSFYISQGELEI
jgi:hypothetical protein